MDHQVFDDVTRSLARGPPRRGVLRTAGVLVLAALGMGVGAGDVAAGTYAPVPLKTPKPFKGLLSRASGRTPCGSKYCTAEQTCNSTGTGCIPKGGVECGSGYCVAEEQTCVNGGCLPQGSTACGNGRCAEDDYCVDGQAVCVDDCPAERSCGGTCCAEGDVCDTETGMCVLGGCFGGTIPTEEGCACDDGPCACHCLETTDHGSLCARETLTPGDEPCFSDADCAERGGYCTVAVAGDTTLAGLCSYIEELCPERL